MENLFEHFLAGMRDVKTDCKKEYLVALISELVFSAMIKLNESVNFISEEEGAKITLKHFLSEVEEDVKICIECFKEDENQEKDILNVESV